jgi:hypothetical protein
MTEKETISQPTKRQKFRVTDFFNQKITVDQLEAELKSLRKLADEKRKLR